MGGHRDVTIPINVTPRGQTLGWADLPINSSPSYRPAPACSWGPASTGERVQRR